MLQVLPAYTTSNSAASSYSSTGGGVGHQETFSGGRSTSFICSKEGGNRKRKTSIPQRGGASATTIPGGIFLNVYEPYTRNPAAMLLKRKSSVDYSCGSSSELSSSSSSNSSPSTVVTTGTSTSSTTSNSKPHPPPLKSVIVVQHNNHHPNSPSSSLPPNSTKSHPNVTRPPPHLPSSDIQSVCKVLPSFFSRSEHMIIDLDQYKETVGIYPIIWRGAQPMRITQEMPGYENLTIEEIKTCSTLRITPLQYLDIKKTLIRAVKNGPFRKREAQGWFKLDVNKTCLLYDWFVALDWIPLEWLNNEASKKASSKKVR